MKRVALGGPVAGDDPTEYWFECDECEGTGTVSVPDDETETVYVEATCPDCGGLGFVEGDADDVDDAPNQPKEQS